MSKPVEVKSKRITAIPGLLNYFKKDIPEKELCWFRGHGRHDWKLLPQLARKKRWLSAEHAMGSNLYILHKILTFGEE
jgi:hypothetical protein